MSKNVPPYALLTAVASELAKLSSSRGSRRSCRRLADGSRPPIWPPGDQPPAGGPAQVAVWSVTIGYLVPVDAVDEGDVGRAAVELVDGDLAVLRELIDQQVAAVHQVVRAVAVDDERADRLVQAGELGRDLLDLAAGAGDLVVLADRGALRGDHLRAHGVDRVGQRAGLLDERLLGGLVVRRLGEVRPGLPELGQLGLDAGVGGLVERELGGVEAFGPRLPVAQVRVLGAVLRVQELVADAAEALDVDAGAEVRADGGRRAGDRDLLRGEADRSAS